MHLLKEIAWVAFVAPSVVVWGTTACCCVGIFIDYLAGKD